MNKLIKFLLIFFAVPVFSCISYSQTEFIVKGGSKTYWAKISVVKFFNNDCSGPGIVTLYDKATI